MTEEDDTYTIEVPDREVHQENIVSGETYRVALISSTVNKSHSTPSTQGGETTGWTSASSQNGDVPTQPPVSEGETHEVEIESIGDQGDGIAKLDRGYVVIVPDTEVGERVTIRLDNTRENVGFAEVIKRHHDIAEER